MSSIAILDLGTNTFQLLIANIIDNKPVLVFEESIAVKLAEGGIQGGYISEAAFDRGITALKEFKKSIDLNQVKTVKAVATSALRSSINGTKFLERIIPQIRRHYFTSIRLKNRSLHSSPTQTLYQIHQLSITVRIQTICIFQTWLFTLKR